MVMIKIREGMLGLGGLLSNPIVVYFTVCLLAVACPIVAHQYFCDVAVHR